MFRNKVHTGSKWKGGDFLHREALVSVAKSYTYDDGPEETGQDAFSREPFVVMFSSKYTGMRWCCGTSYTAVSASHS